MSIDKLQEIESLLERTAGGVETLDSFLYVCQSALLNEHQDNVFAVTASLTIARNHLNTIRDYIALAKCYTGSEKINQVCQNIERGSENV